MDPIRRLVIVGAGLAGAKAAQTLREEGFDGAITLIGAEPHRPYERPPLSKGLLLGSAERDSVYVHPETWYDDNDVDLRTGARVTAIDRSGSTVELVGGERLGYHRLLLATGAEPRRLPVPGADLDGVLHLRTLADFDRVAAAASGGSLVIVGAGWIGLEVAAAARQHGAAVTVVETADLPLQRVLGDQIAGAFADLHRAHDVTFHFGTQVEEIRGRGGRVASVRLSDGTDLSADAVLVAVGARPATDLAEAAGLPVDNGILVESDLRTADPYIHAAGDVANVRHPLLDARIRVEHWSNALHTGPAAARAMLGDTVSYDRLPYFYTDQYDLGMEYTGWVPLDGRERVVLRGDLGKGEYIAFWVRDDRVLAGMNVNVWDVTDGIQALIRAGYAGRSVDPDRLADPDVPLEDALT